MAVDEQPSSSKSDPVPPPDNKSDDPASEPDDISEPVNLEIFEQILELDDGDTHEFSKEMVAAYFLQADSTFTDMDKALEKKDLTKLSELGHFLKGSSAALGISKVQSACERMQHYGELRDEEAKKDLTAAEALSKIEPLIIEAKSEYDDAETWLKKWYADRNESFDDPGPEPEP